MGGPCRKTGRPPDRHSDTQHYHIPAGGKELQAHERGAPAKIVRTGHDCGNAAVCGIQGTDDAQLWPLQAANSARCVCGAQGVTQGKMPAMGTADVDVGGR